ncbi:two-component system, OmpR family, sensor histidine kinase MprB [Amycolatopsis pretoriensis]|uniref:histidine kinase n=1 Tax=Amycolatopsis pretoriensis TaxID=218821 RepID=A0A1H5RHA8_9PSEU|nr:HAMP domain-containing sensor histidine kinase [Amycolatopsis pretoriensis]SEF37765.1 two-component system, OmpR family, sensor histidine kinase MprB [Amycolatopsis pretoriensis]
MRRPRWKTLSLRARLGVLVATAVALAVVTVSSISWGITRADLYDQFDARLQSYTQLAAKAATPEEALATLSSTTTKPGPDRYNGLTVQFTSAAGTVTGTAGAIPELPRLPEEPFSVSRADNVHRVEGDRFRMWTAPRADGGTVQVAQDSEDVEDALGRLGFWLLVVSAAGVLGATVVGRAIARSALQPVDDLTSAAENVARTQELSAAIDVTASGEIGRLATSFNAMLGALSRSRDEQRRLVEDAGHELRTPLTSLRNNIELLIHADANPERQLSADDRSRLLTDLDTQAVELTALIGELVDLSTGERPSEAEERLALADVVTAAVERTRSRWPNVTFEAELTEADVLARPAALERAVLNVLDNAAKWSPAGGRVRVTMSAEGDSVRVRVDDEGPGIPEADLPHVFERFYRADAARALPGSGLGLAIVEQVVTQHGGRATASRAGSGGARFDLVFPSAAS